MDLDETVALVADPNLEQNLRRLREEERLLLEQQAVMEAGNVDDIAALEHQDALRLNQVDIHISFVSEWKQLGRKVMQCKLLLIVTMAYIHHIIDA